MTLDEKLAAFRDLVRDDANLWHIITALRGPDSPSERPDDSPEEHQRKYRLRRERKRATVEVIRGRAVSGACHGARHRTDDHVTLPPKLEWDHFDRHVAAAAGALGLGIRIAGEVKPEVKAEAKKPREWAVKMIEAPAPVGPAAAGPPGSYVFTGASFKTHAWLSSLVEAEKKAGSYYGGTLSDKKMTSTQTVVGPSTSGVLFKMLDQYGLVFEMWPLDVQKGFKHLGHPMTTVKTFWEKHSINNHDTLHMMSKLVKGDEDVLLPIKYTSGLQKALVHAEAKTKAEPPAVQGESDDIPF